MFQPAFEVAQHPKAGQNSQHTNSTIDANQRQKITLLSKATDAQFV